MANTFRPRCRNRAKVPSRDRRMPTTNNMQNPLILVDQLNVVISLICKSGIGGGKSANDDQVHQNASIDYLCHYSALLLRLVISTEHLPQFVHCNSAKEGTWAMENSNENAKQKINKQNTEPDIIHSDLLTPLLSKYK